MNEPEADHSELGQDMQIRVVRHSGLVHDIGVVL